MTSWRISGAGGEWIFGNVDEPRGQLRGQPREQARGVALIAHGFLGYKDYGMLPELGRALCASGLIAHRFNYSHSGMTEKPDTFERADLFEHDTWMKHQADLDAVLEAVASGVIPGAGLPLVLIGHSRGGADVLLHAGRRYGTGEQPLPRMIVTLAAPDSTCTWNEQVRQEFLARGFGEVRSNRTGQTLRIGEAWLREQIEHPDSHDVLQHVRQIGCPILVIHGEQDPTVPSACAHAIAAAGSRGRLVLIESADHVFNTPNPIGRSPRSAQLSAALDAMHALLDQELPGGS